MDQNLGKIPWAIKSNEMQKIILLGTACIIRRFLSIERNTRLAPQERPTNGPGSMRAQEAINSTNNSKNNDYNNTTTTATATATTTTTTTTTTTNCGRQDEPAILISRLLLRLRQMDFH